MKDFLAKPLSPSRLSSYTTCPLSFRYKYIDGIPERPSRAAVRGNVIHRAMEAVFDHPAELRTLEFIVGLLPEAVLAHLTDQPDAAYAIDESLMWESGDTGTDIEVDPQALETFLQECAALVRNYPLHAEDPRRLEPAHREIHLEAEISDSVKIHGIIDRVEVSPSGQVRIADYKSGKCPPPAYQSKSWFQMRVYALLYSKTHGVVPDKLRLIYLTDSQHIELSPEKYDFPELEQSITATYENIARDFADQNFEPIKQSLCRFCSFQEICPAQGGTTLPFPTAR